MNNPKKIIVHCSDSTWGDAKEIDRWHKNNGWKGIGYHYVIVRSGAIESGRNILIQGAHCKGQNKDSIGICLIGVDKFERVQIKALKHLLLMLCDVYNIPKSEIYGHYHFSKKTCPNFDIDIFKEML